MYDFAMVFGESHSDSVRKALAVHRRANYRAVNVGHIEYPLTEGVFVSPLFKDALSPPAGARVVHVSMLGGNAHNILGLVRRGRAFDFILPGEEDIEEEHGSEPQSYAFIEAALRSLMACDLNLLRSARSAIEGPMLHLESPPPFEDEDLIRTDLHPRLASGLDAFEVAPPLLRYKLWRVQSDIVAAACSALEIEYLPAPREAFAGRRFLRADLFKDATHANELYGEMILNQLGDRLVS